MRFGRVQSMAVALVCTTACASVGLAPVEAQDRAPQAQPDGDWQTIHRDLAATRYSPLADINRANVSQLHQAWAYPYRAFNSAVPLVIDGVMYFPAANRLVALDAAPGAEVWVHELQLPARATARKQRRSFQSTSCKNATSACVPRHGDRPGLAIPSGPSSTKPGQGE